MTEENATRVNRENIDPVTSEVSHYFIRSPEPYSVDDSQPEVTRRRIRMDT